MMTVAAPGLPQPSHDLAVSSTYNSEVNFSRASPPMSNNSYVFVPVVLERLREALGRRVSAPPALLAP